MLNEKASGTLALGCAATFIGLVALGLLAVIGFFAVGGLVEVHHQASLMDRATATTATIISSDVRKSVSTTTQSTGGHTTRSTSITYIPEVVYSYSFDARNYKGDQIYTFPRSGDDLWARRVAAQFPPGAQVTAYADPAHPERAFLIRAWVPDPYYLVYTGGGCFAILISMAALATFFFPRVSKRIVIIGAVMSFAVIAYAATHYWIHVGFASSPPDWIALGALATPLLPFGAVWLAKGWRRKFGAAIPEAG